MLGEIVALEAQLNGLGGGGGEEQKPFLFCIVYIAEAHASDEWPISSSRCYSKGPICVPQPTTLQARAELASEVRDEYGVPEDFLFLVDDPTLGG